MTTLFRQSASTATHSKFQYAREAVRDGVSGAIAVAGAVNTLFTLNSTVNHGIIAHAPVYLIGVADLFIASQVGYRFVFKPARKVLGYALAVPVGPTE